MLNWRFSFGLLLIVLSTAGQAASVTMSVSTTVFAVQCTTEQRAKIRACATPEQRTRIGPYKSMVTVESRTDQRVVDAFGPRQEILVDPSRQVMLRTLLY
jgi:hypothetical protein